MTDELFDRLNENSNSFGLKPVEKITDEEFYWELIENDEAMIMKRGKDRFIKYIFYLIICKNII